MGVTFEPEQMPTRGRGRAQQPLRKPVTYYLPSKELEWAPKGNEEYVEFELVSWKGPFSIGPSPDSASFIEPNASYVMRAHLELEFVNEVSSFWTEGLMSANSVMKMIYGDPTRPFHKRQR